MGPASIRPLPDEQEDSWRRDFELWGQEAVRRKVATTGGWDEPRRQAAFRWLREKESESERRERQMRRHMRSMLWLIVAAIGLAVATVRPIMGTFFAAAVLRGHHPEPREFFGTAFWIGFTLQMIAAEIWINYTKPRAAADLATVSVNT